MSLSINTFSDLIAQSSPPQVFISPAAGRSLSQAQALFEDENYLEMQNLMGRLAHEDSLEAPSKVFKQILWALETTQSPYASCKNLKSLFEKLHDKTSHILIENTPVVHRIFFHVYNQAKENGVYIDDPRWGERHAFDSRQILQKAIEATCQEVTKSFLHEELRSLITKKALIKASGELKLKWLRLSPLLSFLDENRPFKAQIQAFSPTKSKVLSVQRPISWLTGTNSYTLIGMHQAFQMGLLPQLGLIPTGALLKHKIVPLAGELGDGIGKKGINLSHLSGVVTSEYKRAYDYALEKKFHFSKEATFCNVASKIKALPRKTHPIEKDLLNPLKIELLRFLQFSEPSKKQRLFIKTALMIWMKCSNLDKSLQEEILSLLESTKYELPQNLDAIVSRPPFPIVFASTSLKDEQLRIVSSSIQGEAVYRGSLLLEDDIQIAITDQKEVPTLRELFKDKKIHVLSFESAELFIRMNLEERALLYLEEL